MKRILILFTLFLSISFYSNAQQYIVSFDVKDKSEIKNLPKYVSVDFVKDNHVRAYLWGENFEKFKKLGYNFTVLPNPNEGKALNMATTVDQMANWDRYPTYGVYVQMMQNFATNYPTICQLDTIGNTQEGRLLLVVKISDNALQNEAEPEFFYTSTIHGDETTGMILSLRFANWLLANYGTNNDATYIVNNFEVFINPDANPDGTYAGGNTTVSGAQRVYASGDDPNRDFPYPLEPNYTPANIETVAMMNFAGEHNFVMSANFHGGAEVYNYPWDCWTSSENLPPDDNWFDHIGNNYVTSARATNSSYMTDVVASGVTEGADWYYAYGSRQDYMNYFHHCKEVTIEVSSTKTLGTEYLNTFWTYNFTSMMNYVKEAIYGFNGTVKNTNGNPLDAKIEIIGYDHDNTWVVTDPANGDYYRPIAPGTYSVTYSAEGYISQTHSVTVTAWQTTTIKNVVLEPAPIVGLTGIVIDGQTGLPISNAKIEFIGTSIPATFTNADGEYSVNVYQNSYQIKASKNGYSSVTKNISATPTSTEFDFVLVQSDAISFEDGIPTGFTFSGNANWTRVTDQAYDGTYSMKSGAIGNSQSSSMTYTVTTQAGEFSFYKKVSSEASYDELTFYIDGVEKDVWSGDIDWSMETYTVTSGNHTFKWTYSKDGSQIGGSDCAWVDFIDAPSNSIPQFNLTFTVLDGTTPVQNAEVHLFGYGNSITNTSGQYVYSNVYETTDSLSFTVQAAGYDLYTGKVKVSGNTTKVVQLNPGNIINENTDNFNVYPNPSNGIVNITLPESKGNISVISITGKEVLRKNTDSNSEIIDLTSQPAGIYYIKFNSDNYSVVKKIIIK